MRPPVSPSIVGEGPESLDAPIILPATVPAVSLDVPILMYHLVDQIPPRSIEPSTGDGASRSGSPRCRAHSTRRWRTSRASSATSISLQHLADALLYGLPLPPHPFVITFDDGRLSQWTNAVPVLRADGFTAVFFPCTGLIGAQGGTADVHDGRGDSEPRHHRVLDRGSHRQRRHRLLLRGSSLLDSLTNRTRTDLEDLTGDPVQFIAYTRCLAMAAEHAGHESRSVDVRHARKLRIHRWSPGSSRRQRRPTRSTAVVAAAASPCRPRDHPRILRALVPRSALLSLAPGCRWVYSNADE